MTFTQLLSYPELVAAAALAVAVPASACAAGKLDAPAWLNKAASSLAIALPAAYFDHLGRLLAWANLRDAQCQCGLFSGKLLVACLTALPAAFVDPLFVPFAALIGYILPDIILYRRVKQRQAEIRQILPQALDLMVMCVDAGLALDASVQRITVERFATGNALNDELVCLSKDLLLGMEREQAYRSLFSRSGVDELKMLGSALNQSARMGLSIAKVLRAQAQFLRDKQRAYAEERALKLPILMAFPMWLCIMPALLIVLVGPSVIGLLTSLGRL